MIVTARRDEPARLAHPRRGSRLRPPAYILTAAFDPLRDEGRAYADRLRAAGVQTEYACLEGALHAALSFGVLETGRRGRTAVARAIRKRLAHESGGSRSGSSAMA